MKPYRLLAVFVLGLLAVTPLLASGPVSLYGIVEKVVFEPKEEEAERIQVWGAFLYVNTGAVTGGATSAAKKGYLYFQLPVIMPGGSGTEAKRVTARREWNDLKSVAGTGQAVAFGNWMYFSEFSYLQPDVRPVRPSFISEFISPGGAITDLRVRPASEPPATPAMYQTNVGVVKLTEASHTDVIQKLKEALK